MNPNLRKDVYSCVKNFHWPPWCVLIGRVGLRNLIGQERASEKRPVELSAGFILNTISPSLSRTSMITDLALDLMR